MLLTLHTDGIGGEADVDTEEAEVSEKPKKGARMTTSKVGCLRAIYRRVYAHKVHIAQGNQLLLGGERQEQEPTESGAHEVAAHRQACGGETRPQVMIHMISLLRRCL